MKVLARNDEYFLSRARDAASRSDYISRLSFQRAATSIGAMVCGIGALLALFFGHRLDSAAALAACRT